MFFVRYLPSFEIDIKTNKEVDLDKQQLKIRTVFKDTKIIGVDYYLDDYTTIEEEFIRTKTIYDDYTKEEFKGDLSKIKQNQIIFYGETISIYEELSSYQKTYSIKGELNFKQLMEYICRFQKDSRSISLDLHHTRCCEIKIDHNHITLACWCS